MADQTIGKKFTFRVFSRRWGHEDTYHLTRTATGWHVKHMSINGDCDKYGRPVLFDNFRQDFIAHPPDTDFSVGQLWDAAARDNLTEAEVQERLQAIADRVSAFERKATS